MLLVDVIHEIVERESRTEQVEGEASKLPLLPDKSEEQSVGASDQEKLDARSQEVLLRVVSLEEDLRERVEKLHVGRRVADLLMVPPRKKEEHV